MSLITGTELAKQLGVSRVTVLNYAKKGMPCVIVGQQRKYISEDVREWLRGGGNSGNGLEASKLALNLKHLCIIQML